MLKRVKVSDLRCGMYLQEVCGSWIEHPFWRSSFLLSDPADIAKLEAHGIGEVWIDTARGLDLAGEPIEAATEEGLTHELSCAAASFTAQPVRISLMDEVQRASAICARTRQAVESLFDQARLGKALQAEAVMPVVDDVIASVQRHPCALISLARMKSADDPTYEHSVAVCAMMTALGRQLGLAPDVLREVALGGLLHDIGKIAVPRAILGKPEPLDPTEREAIRVHPVAGEKILRASVGVSDIVREICLHHHERADGSGYPDHERDDAITSYAMMAAVCDVYDAVTSDRRYKTGWNPAVAMSKMAGWCDTHFDQTIFRAFVKTVGIYPTGSLVRLRSGNLAVVLDQSPESLLKPVVKMFYSVVERASLQSKVIELAGSGDDDAIVSLEDPRAWSVGDLNHLWKLDLPN